MEGHAEKTRKEWEGKLVTREWHCGWGVPRRWALLKWLRFGGWVVALGPAYWTVLDLVLGLLLGHENRPELDLNWPSKWV